MSRQVSGSEKRADFGIGPTLPVCSDETHELCPFVPDFARFAAFPVNKDSCQSLEYQGVQRNEEEERVGPVSETGAGCSYSGNQVRFDSFVPGTFRRPPFRPVCPSDIRI
ncbi:hypothetical protein [Parasutterella sp.]|jgi:hypothetical protein|uniref:hypothetical protein n=1 Tax=Parasutterella sp. TaxID=2049037 RepID=UPI0035200139